MILRRWDCLCLDRRDLNLIMMIGKFRRRCQVKKFLAIAVGLLGSSLFETMIMICDLFTHEPEGGSAMVPVTLFMEIYGYLAGLRCDGGERDSSDEDPTEFIICRESNDSRSLASQEHSEDRFSVDRVCSIASQDTEADVNLDLEMVSKEDVDSSRSKLLFQVTMFSYSLSRDAYTILFPYFFFSADITPQLGESYTSRRKMLYDKMEQDSSSEGTLKVDGNNETSGADVELSRRFRSSDEKKSNKSENPSGSSTPDGNASKDQSVRSAERKASSERRKKKILNAKLLKYRPNIPGIGPRLSAEEVASVAIWMSECARMQEGMVGPRNLRHMNCPPLDRQISES
ncbi:uncharacterized protein LOC128872145 isoform X3 [Hylaeus volcanicus]|nr:uncharacterized protein LOC128872145 isoform X3 [Hylaeus volcanicus]